MGFIIGSTLSEVIKYDLSAYKNESSVHFFTTFSATKWIIYYYYYNIGMGPTICYFSNLVMQFTFIIIIIIIVRSK